MRLLLGVETEYALHAVTSHGEPAGREEVAYELFDLARLLYPCLPDGSSNGLFLPNGGRLYLDAGAHPELATPECADPWEALRHLRAGERLLDRLARQLLANGGYSEVTLFRSNVDYQGETWGSHESYLLRSYDAPFLAEQLIPHLVSRIVYAGAGGFDPRTAGGHFTLSPRAWFLTSPVSNASLSDRPLLHLKDEPHCEGSFHRLHLICGETLCSDTATVLRLGTTALISALADRERRVAWGVQLEDPLDALQQFADDPTLTVTARGFGGRELTALQIQRHYLSQVQAGVWGGELPEWAPRLVTLWRDILDRLERDLPSLHRTLDWTIKRALYGQWLAQRGGSRLGARRPELLEADLRFGQLGRPSVFGELDAQGVLDHRQCDPGTVDEALLSGPAGDRGRLRSEWIRRLAAPSSVLDGRYACGWSGIWDEISARQLRFTDPFATTAAWEPMRELPD